MSFRIRFSVVRRVVIGFALGIALLWWLLRGIDGQRLIHDLSSFSWTLLVPVMTLVFVSMAVRAYRWQLLFMKDPPSLLRLFFVENTGIGVNSIAPIRVLAEPIQFGYLVLQDGRDRGSVLASIVLVRIVDMTVTLVMIAVGLVLYPPAGTTAAWVWRGMGLLTAIPVIVTVLSLVGSRWGWLTRWYFFNAYSTAWRQLLSSPLRLVQVLVVTFIQWVLLGVAAWIISEGLGIGLYLPVVVILTLGIMTLGLLLPGLPSGVGPFEFAATLLLSIYGVTREPAFAFGIIVHAAFLLPPIAVAAITLVAFGPPWRSARAPLPHPGFATTPTSVEPRNEQGVGTK